MINTDDFIQYSNVIQKTYQFNYREMQAVMDNFFEMIADMDVTIKGPFFFSLATEPVDDIMTCELFMPIVEDIIVTSKDLMFHSYYEVRNMLSQAVVGDLDINSGKTYDNLMLTLINNDLDQASPIYHIYPKDDSMQYVILKVAYA